MLDGGHGASAPLPTPTNWVIPGSRDALLRCAIAHRRMTSTRSFTLRLLGDHLFQRSAEPVFIWRRRTSVRAIPASPNEGMESTDVDEVNVVRGDPGRPRRDERHGRSRFRGGPVLRAGDIAAGLQQSY